MIEQKHILKSKTILAAIVAFATAVLPTAGVSFTAEDGALITGAWDQIIIAVSAVVAAYGRVTAKTQVKL